MSSKPRLHSTAVAALIALASWTASGQSQPRFFPDDPILVDDDRVFDAGKAKAAQLSEGFDFLENQFGSPGDRRNIRAVNVNTLDKVPDSSWFTNRIGRTPMSIAEIERGPDTIDRFDVTEWVVTGGKGPAGFQPGFRAKDSRDKRPGREAQVYQLEGDTKDYPELASGSEMIGTFFYHAMGYNVVDTYVVNVDPAKVTIAPGTTVRDSSGRRPFTRGDLDSIFRLLARNPDGTYRMTASRFVEGLPLEAFRYQGTRSDDPNDIYPHEHRRELRGNRVFCAWLNHDDSRAINTLDMVVTANGRNWIKHYMFDFGSLLGSSPRPWSGIAYMYEGGQTWKALASLGFWIPRAQLTRYPTDLPPAVGRVESDAFRPERWKPEYPNPAFDNMRLDDAFWAARIVAAFSNEAIEAIVRKAKYSDPRATKYISDALIKRRDKIARYWLTAVNPVVDFALSNEGALTFRNAAVEAGAAAGGQGYVLQWSRFDNRADRHDLVGVETTTQKASGTLPAGLANAEYVGVTVRSIHPEFSAWKWPVQAYFRRVGSGWQTVGLTRQIADK